MKQPMSIYSNSYIKQQGFTLLEALVALIILSIVVIGSGVTLNQMLKTQKSTYVNGIIIDQMQTRMQAAAAGNANVCNAIDRNSFNVDGQDYFLGCSTQAINVGGAVINWPVLAAGTTQAIADGCADGSAVITDCYIVGN